MNPAQRAYADAVVSGRRGHRQRSRGAGAPPSVAPSMSTCASAELAQQLRKVGEHVRFKSSLLRA